MFCPSWILKLWKPRALFWPNSSKKLRFIKPIQLDFTHLVVAAAASTRNKFKKMQRLITSIAKSVKNSSSSRRYHARELSSSSCVGKSINSNNNNNRIITEEFQQRRRFRSTSSFLSNYSNKSSNFGLRTTIRSFSSSGTGADEISKELTVPYVVQLVDTLIHHPVATTVFLLFLTTYFTPRFLKFMYARLPYDVPYENTLLSKIKLPINNVVVSFAFAYLSYTDDPSSIVTMDSIKAFYILFVVTFVIPSINKCVEEYMIGLKLPFSVGDTVKIPTPSGYLQGIVVTTGQDSSMRPTVFGYLVGQVGTTGKYHLIQWTSGMDHSCVPYCNLLSKFGYLVGQVETTGKYNIIQWTSGTNHFCVPYSNLASKVIVRSIVKTIPLKIHDVDKISQISEDVISMMRSNPNVNLEMGFPYCNCSQQSSYVKLTFGCDVKNQKSEWLVFRDAVRIIKEHGGELISDIPEDDGQSELGYW